MHGDIASTESSACSQPSGVWFLLFLQTDQSSVMNSLISLIGAARYDIPVNFPEYSDIEQCTATRPLQASVPTSPYMTGSPEDACKGLGISVMQYRKCNSACTGTYTTISLMRSIL